MRFVNTETPTFAGASGTGGAAAVVERMALYDRNGTEVGYFEKSVSGSMTFSVDGNTFVTEEAASITLAATEIILSGLPTEDPAVEGALWSDTGTVKVSAGA